MATIENALSWLPEDLSGKSSTNLVKNEKHVADTTGPRSQFVIIPYEGAFYDTDNLRVEYHTQTKTTTLVRDNDYRLVGIDYGRTKVSAAQGGVYHFILITTVFNYDPNCYISITYQAFGGYLSSRAYQAFVDEINAIKEKIDLEGVITEGSLPQSPTIQTIVNQLQSIAARIQYAPSVKYLAPCSYDSNINWKTFAVSTESYDKSISFGVLKTLQGAAIFTFVSDYLIMKVAFHYDLSGTPTLGADVLYQKILQLDTTKFLNDSRFFQSGRMFIPRFRLAVDTSDAAPKVYLQMTLACNKDNDLQMFITDSTDMTMDDVENIYELTEDATFQDGKNYYVREGVDNYYRYSKVDVEVGATIPADTYYELTSIGRVHNAFMASKFALCPRSTVVETPVPPDAETTLYSNEVIALRHGYKIWEGCINLSTVQDMSFKPITIHEEYNVPDELMLQKTENGYPVTFYGPEAPALGAKTINNFVIDVYDRYEQRMLTVTMPARQCATSGTTVTTNDYEIMGTGCYFIPDLATVDVHIRFKSGVTSVAIYAKSGKSSYKNARFDLRTIYVC